MLLLLVLLVVGSAVRLLVLVKRPSVEQRFRRRRRRRILAKKAEELGDATVFATTVAMVLFGFGHSPSRLVMSIWAGCLVGGFAAALFAHEIAHRYRPPRRVVVARQPSGSRERG